MDRDNLAPQVETGDRRFGDREELTVKIEGRAKDGSFVLVIRNLSANGILAEADFDVAVGEVLDLDVPGGAHKRAMVVWSDDGLVGLKFLDPLPRSAMSAAKLKSDPLLARAPGEESPVETGEKLPRHMRLLTIAALAAVPWIVAAAVLVFIFG